MRYARCYEGACRWARQVVVGLELSTSTGSRFRFGICDVPGDGPCPVERVQEHSFPSRLTSVWGREGFVIDELGFEYL